MELMSLPEDCWNMICEFVDVEDKVSLANTSNDLLRSIIHANMRVHKPINVNQKLWHHLSRYESDVEDFMILASKHVEQLELNGMDHTQFEIVRKLQLPKIKRLYISRINERPNNHGPDMALLDVLQNTSSTLQQLTLDDCPWHDLSLLSKVHFPKVTSVGILSKPDFVEDYKLLTEMFPSMTKLSITAPISSFTLWDLRGLSELTVMVDAQACFITSYRLRTLVPMRLRKLSIFKKPSCTHCIRAFEFNYFLYLFEQLDELCIDCHISDYLSFSLLQRKKVRKITFIYDNLSFCDYDHHFLWTGNFRSQIESITINSFLLKRCPNLRKFLAALVPHLKRMVVVDKHGSGEDQSRKRFKPNSTELRTRQNARGCHNSIEDLRPALLAMIANSEHLESFEVSAHICNLEFLRGLIEAVRSKQNRRAETFTLRLLNTNIAAEDLKEISLPVGLDIQFQSREFELPAIDSVEMELVELP